MTLTPNYENEPPLKEVVAVVGAKSIETDLTVRGHRFCCDETEPLGGHDSAPDPYDYILAGLGACTAISLRQYADRKQWPLDKVEIRLTYQKAWVKRA
jgi:putative redox protein